MNARAMKRLNLGLPNDPFSITTSTFQATIDYHGRYLLLNRALGTALKLPAANGSGTLITIIVQKVPTTTPCDVISTNPSTDIFAGSITNAATTGNGKLWATGTTDNTITLNGTTTGGVSIGDQIELVDIAAGIWAVVGTIVASGTIATPFSHV